MSSEKIPARGRTWKARVAAVSRWLHVYLSMMGLFVLLFFSVTGITLNHPTWLGAGLETTRQEEGKLERAWVAAPEDPPSEEPEGDGADSVAKLEVVEHLRKAHGLRGAVASLTADETECAVTFKGPGYSADVFIDRETGGYQLTETSHGLVAVMNDLHKGRDSGRAWSLLIDVSAGVLVLASLSGLVLLFYLKRRRTPGLIVGLVGTAAFFAMLRFLVP